jgi:hypothetical protein
MHDPCSHFRGNIRYHDDANVQQLVENGLQRVASEKRPAADASRDWAWRLAEDAIGIGHTLSASSSPEAVSLDSRNGKAMVATAGALLLATSCCKAIAAAPLKTGHHDPSLGVLNVLVRELLEVSDDDNDETMVTFPSGGETLRSVQRERSLAVEELKDALSLFGAELSVASAVQETRKSEERR